MLQKNRKGLFIGLIGLAVLASLAFFLSQAAKEPPATSVETVIAPETQPARMQDAAVSAPAQEQQAQDQETSAPEQMQGDDAAKPATIMADDRVLGSDSAPVTVIEYASLTCSHCADFATQVLPEIKKTLIDTGKLRLVFRDFPLNKPALKAAMMARCLSADKYFGMIDMLFSSQERWLSNEDPMKGLEQMGALAGMDSETFEKCVSDENLEKKIVAGMQEAQEKYQINSTPSFVFNNGAEIFKGGKDAAAFAETVNKLSGATQKE